MKQRDLFSEPAIAESPEKESAQKCARVRAQSPGVRAQLPATPRVKRLRVEFSQPPVRPNPDRGLIWLSDCAHYAVVLGDRLCGTPMVEMGLRPVYRGIWISPEGQRLIRRSGRRSGRYSFEQAALDCRRHERAMRLGKPKRKRKKLREVKR